jgi:hypothetical protein
LYRSIFLGVGTSEKLSVVFTPADAAEYAIVTDAVSINVANPTPTPTPTTTTMGITVPAYFAPGTGGPGGVGDGWAAMAAAAAKVPLTAIFDPNNGPLPGPASSAYANAFTELEDAGGKVVAYISFRFDLDPNHTTLALRGNRRPRQASHMILDPHGTSLRVDARGRHCGAQAHQNGQNANRQD